MSGDAGLALRLLKRDWQAGELRILILALLIAVSSTTLIQFFADRLQRGMLLKATDLIGGDLVISSSRPIPAPWLDKADALNTRKLLTLEFGTVALHGEKMQMASVKAVEQAYPLKGMVKTADRPWVEGEPALQGPSPGSVWAEARILGGLGIKVGDTLEIGDQTLTVSGVLTQESDRGGNFYSFTSRIIMAMADVPATNVLQPGSRITYRLVLAGPQDAIDEFRLWVKPQLSAHEKLQDVRNERPELSGALVKAEDYLGLSSLMAVLLAGVAIAMAASRYSVRHFDMSAMLRCLGATQGRIVRIYSLQFLVIGIAGSALGCALGWAGQFVLEILLRSVLPVELPAPGWTPVWTGLATGFVTLIGFALPPVLRLHRVPPLRVLRRDVLPPAPAAWGVYGVAIAALGLLMWPHTGNARLTVTVLGGTLVVLVLFALLAVAVLGAVQGLRHQGLAWRIGIRRLGRNRAASVGQLLAFSLTLMAMTLLVLVRTDLLGNWQAQLPADAPNHFAINVQDADRQAFTDFLDQRNLPRSFIYPMVRGRLTHVNDRSLFESDDTELRQSNDMGRELNLTVSAQMSPDNRIVAGQWWPQRNENNAAGDGSVARPVSVSLEQRFAARMGVKLGDHLIFSIAGAPLHAQVMSLRAVKWDSFRPNFFVVFEPGTLTSVPVSWMTSFHLPPERKLELNTLVQQFPSVTVLEIDVMLGQVRTIMTQVMLAVEFILVFALTAGVVVLWSAVQVTLSERLQEGALLRTLGADRALLTRARRVEFLVLGGLAGLLAATGAEAVLWILHQQVFDLEFALNPWVWLVVPLLGMLLVGSAGLMGTRPVLNAPPQRVLRDIL